MFELLLVGHWHQTDLALFWSLLLYACIPSMTIFNQSSCHLQPQKMNFVVNQIFMIFFLLLLPCVNSVFFNHTSFQSNMDNMIFFEKDAFMAGRVLELTKNQLDDSISGSVGRASYAERVRLWDAKTGELTDFITHFSFVINALNRSRYGDGLAFFIAPIDSGIPSNSSSGFLGLFSNESAFTPSLNTIVAVWVW